MASHIQPAADTPDPADMPGRDPAARHLVDDERELVDAVTALSAARLPPLAENNSLKELPSFDSLRDDTPVTPTSVPAVPIGGA